jgi:phosphoglycerol transferase MdoB-like AlkP superfamily enzyme
MFKASIQYLLIPSILLLFIFLISKLIFITHNGNSLGAEQISDLAYMFIASLRLDFSVLSYLLFIPSTILFLASLFFSNKWIHKTLFVYFACIFVISIVSNIIDTELFSYWNARLSAKALLFLDSPEMMAKSAGIYRSIQIAFLMLILSYLFIVILQINFNQIAPIPKSFKQLLFYPIILGLLIVGLRGGLQEIPINQSAAYFTDHPVINVAGVNSLWNLGNVYFQNQNSLVNNPYKTMSDEKATNIFKELYYTDKDSSIQILNIEKPNIVYIVLEGVNANCIQNFNPKNNYMPYVSKIMNEGYTFTNMFASGMRTDQGLVAIMSGFPALPLHTIGAQPEKFQHLPSLPLSLKKDNYSLSFFFGGEPEFGSLKAYLSHNSFDKIYSRDDFANEELTQDLGAPDKVLFDKFLKDMKNPSEPFVSWILTQSTHEPFDMPFNEGIEDDAIKYIRTVKYVDEVIGTWYEAVKELPWFKNTLFIISSDHAHTFPERYWYTDKERYHIPFILFGPALNNNLKGSTNTQLVNQTDIPFSLAKQFKVASDGYEFSKDIFNPYSPAFSSFIHIHGHNWIRNEQTCSVNFELKNDFGQLTKEEDACTLENAAYIQYVFKKYMEY